MKNILIVDDEEMLREVVSFDIEDGEFKYDKIFEAESGNKAMEILQKEKIDLLITDIQMPDGTGIELLKFMKDKGYKIPTIVMSGFSKSDEIYSCDYDVYLSKPLEVDEFHQWVDKLLNK